MLIHALFIPLLVGSTDAEVMTIAEFVQKLASKPGGNHIAMIYAFITMLDIDSSIKRTTAHRWYVHYIQTVSFKNYAVLVFIQHEICP